MDYWLWGRPKRCWRRRGDRVLTKLERDSIRRFRAAAELPAGAGSSGETEAWSGFTLRMLLEAARVLRKERIRHVGNATLKLDGSPTVVVEQRVEMELSGYVSRLAPEAAFIGEEFGGTLPTGGLAVAVDPVDGTWAFINGMETYATSITVFLDGEAIVAGVGNPSTGEIAYAARNGSARLVQVSAFGEGDEGVTLPMPPGEGTLVNVHPSRAAGPVFHSLQEAWQERNVRLVRATGGSPAWAMVEAAKGRFVYVNLWSARDVEPYDLAGAALIMRAGGGEVIDVSGQPVCPLTHRGPFIAAADTVVADTVRRIVFLGSKWLGSNHQ